MGTKSTRRVSRPKDDVFRMLVRFLGGAQFVENFSCSVAAMRELSHCLFDSTTCSLWWYTSLSHSSFWNRKIGLSPKLFMYFFSVIAAFDRRVSSVRMPGIVINRMILWHSVCFLLRSSFGDLRFDKKLPQNRKISRDFVYKRFTKRNRWRKSQISRQIKRLD